MHKEIKLLGLLNSHASLMAGYICFLSYINFKCRKSVNWVKFTLRRDQIPVKNVRCDCFDFPGCVCGNIVGWGTIVIFLGLKGDWHVRLTAALPSVSLLSKKYGSNPVGLHILLTDVAVTYFNLLSTCTICVIICFKCVVNISVNTYNVMSLPSKNISRSTVHYAVRDIKTSL
jgi:hypothetical protein